jgi:hypothetical protein
LLRRAGGSARPMCWRASSRGARGKARGAQPAWDWSGVPSSPREYPWWGGVRLGVVRGRRPGDLYSGHKAVVRVFPLRSKAADRGMGTAWARGGNVRRTEQPVAARRARTGERHATWHRPRGLAHVTPPCRTVPTALASDRQSLRGLGVRAASTTTRADAVRHDVTRSRHRSNDLALFDRHKLEFLELKCTQRPIRKL